MYGTQRIWSKTLDLNRNINIRICGRPKIPSEEFPKKEQKITVYQDKDFKYFAMPDLEILKKKYSLRKN